MLITLVKNHVLVYPRDRDSRNESRADDDSRNEPSTLLFLETVCVLKLTFNEMMKLSSVFEKMM